MQKVIILKGPPTSGKTYWAKQAVKDGGGKVKRVNRDDLRSMLDNDIWSPQNEKIVTSLENYAILQALHSGFDVIVDDTNLNPKTVEHFKTLVAGKAKVEIKEFSETLNTLLERNQDRDRYVPEDVIKRMYNQQRTSVPLLDIDQNLPNCIVVDIDGTLALHTSGRSPYDYSRVSEDTLNTYVAWLAKSCYLANAYIFLVSGRDESSRKETVKWLEANHIRTDLPDIGEFYRFLYYALHMRMNGDGRKDYTVKEEIYKQHIQGKYNVLAWIDDRPSVCRHIRSLGLPVFQVGDPDHEF